jgi:hypothetical protein
VTSVPCQECGSPIYGEVRVIKGRHYIVNTTFDLIEGVQVCGVGYFHVVCQVTTDHKAKASGE